MSNRPSKKPLPSQRVNDARIQAQRSRSIWIVGAVAAAVVFALVVTVALTAGGQDSAEPGADKGTAGTVVPAGTLDYGEVTVEGTPLPPFQGLSPDPAVGQAVPALAGQQFDGAPISFGGANPDGKPYVILGLAHWCPHCQKEVPFVSTWLEENGMPEDVDLFALSTAASDSRVNWPVDRWLVREEWTVPTMVDDEAGTGAQALGLGSFPYFLVADAEGNVIWRGSGEKLTDEEWEPVIEAARTGQPPAQAPTR